MRKDIAKLLCERQRIGSRETSVKTSLKFDPNLNYDDSFDSGPTYVSSARHRQEGRCNPVAVNMGKKKNGHSKNLNENLNPLFRFLQKSVGRFWDDVYSEIRENINPSKAIDYHVLQHVGWHVKLHVTMIDGVPYVREYGMQRPVTGLYVYGGILKDAPRERREGPRKPVENIHWYGNVWFESQTHKKRAKCGCVHFKVASVEPKRRFYNDPDREAVCIHGNTPIKNVLWYVVEYGYHSPDEVYRTVKPISYVIENGLRKTVYGEPVVTYYRDVPEKLAQAFVVSRKAVNSKHLKIIKDSLKID